MTVKDAINQARKLSATEYPDDMLLDWLNEFEVRIQHDILDTDSAAYVTYTELNDTKLILDHPWTQLYILYLLSRIYLYRQETAQYANCKAAFDEMFQDYAAAYQQIRTDYSKSRWIVT
jgi:hypothetical protein